MINMQLGVLRRVHMMGESEALIVTLMRECAALFPLWSKTFDV